MARKRRIQKLLQELNITNIEHQQKIQDFQAQNNHLKNYNTASIIIFTPLVIVLCLALIFLYKQLRRTQQSLIESLKNSGVISESNCSDHIDVAKELEQTDKNLEEVVDKTEAEVLLNRDIHEAKEPEQDAN
eukprot:EST45805.1 Hypothetical protein SS50377_14380 [Spironucleus salmonicida]